VNYSGDNVAMIDSIRLNGSIINNAYIVLGKNYKGNIEATIIPAKEQRYKNEGIVEYYYLRFHPNWFKKNIAPHINVYLQDGSKLADDLINKAAGAHKNNFSYCCHFNEYPLVSEGLLFTRISLLGVADKITMFTNSNDN
jgi:hypothetical protein